MRSLMFMAVLAMPGIALGQSKPVVVEVQLDGEKPAAKKGSDTDRKLAQMEERLQAMIREIQALRTGSTAEKRVTKVETKSGEQKRVVVAAPVPDGKAGMHDMTWKVVPFGLAQAPQVESKTIILRLAPDGKGPDGKQLAGTIKLDGVNVQLEAAKQAEHAAKRAIEGGNVELRGKVLIIGEDGKLLPEGQIQIQGVAPKLVQPAKPAPVAAPVPQATKTAVARVINSQDGKFIIELVEDKPGEKPNMFYFTQPGQPGEKKGVFFYEQPQKPGETRATSKVVRTFANVGNETGTINLTRVTYSMNPAQAHALDSFLKENAKASVLETKVEGDKLTVTTTPDVQRTIGQVIALMSGKTVRATHQVHPTSGPQGEYKIETIVPNPVVEFLIETRPQPKQEKPRENPPYSEKDD